MFEVFGADFHQVEGIQRHKHHAGFPDVTFASFAFIVSVPVIVVAVVAVHPKYLGHFKSKEGNNYFFVL